MLEYRPWPATSALVIACHGVALALVLALAADVRLAAVLSLVLAASALMALATARRQQGWRLRWYDGNWTLVGGMKAGAVSCNFTFVSSRLVAVSVSRGGRRFRNHLLLAAGNSSADEWRRLHIIAARARREPLPQRRWLRGG